MRIAAIDIGTNSIHMIVVKVRPDLSFEVIDREKEMVRLGAGGLDGRSLTPTAMTAALQALTKFSRLAATHKVDEILAGATSATREADNGGDFIAEVERQTGIRVRVISGTEEARLIHLAAGYGVNIGGTQAVVIDIGGGSVEVTLGTATHLTQAQSFKLGVIRLTERFVRSDPLSNHDERRLVKHINKTAGVYLDEIAGRGFERAIGTSGTILSLGALALSEDAGVPPEELRNQRVPAKTIRRIRKRLTSVDLDTRLHTPGLDPRRADIAVAGSVLLDAILRRLGAEGPHALRSRAARRADSRLHPPQHRAHQEGRELSGRPPPQRRRARRTLRILVGARATSRADRPVDLRPDARGASSSAIASASGSNTARCCTTSACTSATSVIIAIRTT